MTDEQNTEAKNSRPGLIDSVKTPIAFFSLVVLVIEASLLGLTVSLKDSILGTYTTIGMVLLLSLLVLIVTILAIKQPGALYGKPGKSSEDVSILLDANQKQDYDNLFAGFTKSVFLAYNAPFRIEDFKKRVRRSARKLHLDRYQNDVEAKYLFFETDDFERAKSFFSELQTDAIEKNSSIDGKIELLYLPEEKAPAYSYFVGYRSDKARCIIYHLGADDQLPQAVIVVDEHEGLLGKLEGHFVKQWNVAKESSGKDSWTAGGGSK
jgi:hypothetical protein